jgi:hypothetical protein
MPPRWPNHFPTRCDPSDTLSFSPSRKPLGFLSATPSRRRWQGNSGHLPRRPSPPNCSPYRPSSIPRHVPATSQGTADPTGVRPPIHDDNHALPQLGHGNLTCGRPPRQQPHLFPAWPRTQRHHSSAHGYSPCAAEMVDVQAGMRVYTSFFARTR